MKIEVTYDQMVVFLQQLEASLASGINAELHVIGRGYYYTLVKLMAQRLLANYKCDTFYHNRQMLVYFSDDNFSRLEGSDRAFVIADDVNSMSSLLRDFQNVVRSGKPYPNVAMLFAQKDS